MPNRTPRRCFPWILVLAVLLLAAPARADDADAERRLAEAWHLLEVDRKPAEAARRYEALAASRPSTSVHARALLGWARAERLRGNDTKAQSLIDEALRLAPELAGLSGALAQDAGARGAARFVVGRLYLPRGSGLDFDSGGVFQSEHTPRGGRVELMHGAEGLVRPAGAVEDAAFGRRLAVPGPRTWLRVETDEGRQAWFQVASLEPVPMLRFITRIVGNGPVHPQVRGAFAVGRGQTIEIRFEQDPAFTRYRIEVQRDGRGGFRPLAEVGEPRFSHEGVDPGRRYVYRITGLAADGHAGIPTTVLATSRSAGIVRGEVALRRGEGVDLLTGETVTEHADLRMTQTYGGASAAGFVDAAGHAVRPIAAGSTPRTPWGGTSPARNTYIEDGDGFLVLLPGGALARATLTLERPERGVRREVVARVRYEVHTDGPVFPASPEVSVGRTDEGVVVRVAGVGADDEIHAEAYDPAAPGVRRTLADRSARDAVLDPEVQGKGEVVVAYDVTIVDRFGRRGPTARAVYDGRPRGVRTGSFELHYDQGWSFLQGAHVGRAEADVWFSSAAGGISSIELSARGGIQSLERAAHEPLVDDRRRGPSELLAACVVGLDPARLALRRAARGDRRTPASDVFVLRVAGGGWARLAITHRAKHATGGWTKLTATIVYAWNPHAPQFEDELPAGADRDRSDGLIVRSLEAALAHRQRAVLGHLPDKPFEGAFRLREGEGYSFETHAIVDDPGAADVIFDRSAGGLSSVTLATPGGGVALEDLRPKGADATPEALFAGLVGTDGAWPPAALGGRRLRMERVRADRRDPASQVAILRTRHGGWVKLVLVARHKEGGRDERAVGFRYVFHPSAPVFDAAAEAPTARGPLLVRSSALALFPAVPEPRQVTRWRPAAEPPTEAWLPADRAAPPEGFPWLLAMRAARVTREDYDRVRVALLRHEDDARVVAGLVYLAGAHDPRLRRLAARSLVGAYMLGAQGGAGVAAALRTLAKDPDPWVAHTARGMGGAVFDTPLYRELLVQQLDGTLPMAEGKLGAWQKENLDARLASHARQGGQGGPDPRTLVESGDREAIDRWIAAARSRPAGASEGRFEILVLEAGKPMRVVQEPGDPAMGVPAKGPTLTASGFEVLRAADGIVSSDAYTLREDGGGGGYSQVGGATPFAGGRGGTQGHMMDTLKRVVGEGRLRVYRRASREPFPRGR